MSNVLNEFKKNLFDAGIVDMNPDNNGAIIWLPNGMIIRNIFIESVRESCLEHSFEEFLFPTMVSGKEFRTMSENIFDFSNNVYYVDEDKVLRPSGESIIYPQFRRWIKSYKDLPIRAFQIGTSFRKLTPRSVFRIKEQDLFVEGHTAHTTAREAEEQFCQNIELIRAVLEFLGLPTIYTYRPVWGNKPVSNKTAGIDTLLPNGETILAGCAYLQNQIFSKPFNIQFTNQNNQKDFTYQTEFGLSAKTIFASLFITSDSKGLNILPEIAPIQVIILPVVNDDAYDEVFVYATQVKDILMKSGVRCKIDTSEKSIGKKQYQYEKNGVPVRIVIGEKELQSNEVCLYSREEGSKTYAPIKSVVTSVKGMLEISSDLIRKRISTKHFGDIIEIFSINEETNKQITNGKVVKYPLCFNPECCQWAEKRIKGEIIGYEDFSTENNCVVCNSKTKTIAYHARRM
ncbi:MAG: proline--tRNA ligase [Clostridia bacterium]|nr:proline--tRNA ligase [Clostridia bacterium]MBP3597819.1 proline--tRNA ligase [Clostridia bacterium]